MCYSKIKSNREESEKMSATIYDIAAEAGVSPATVSRILNGTAKVSQDKRERVEEIIRKYEFVPNARAKALSSRTSKMIGVLVADVRNPFYASFYVEFETAAIAQGYSVVLCNAINDENLEKEQLKMMADRNMDVIVICGGRTDTLTPDDEQTVLMKKIADKVPVIVTGTGNSFPCSKITLDNRPAMEALMSYLIGLGHRDFAMIGGSHKKLPTYEKQSILREILNRNDLPCREDWFIETSHYGIQDGYEAGKKLFRREELPTAVLGINEMVTLGAMRAATEAGLRIPEDISFAGFDNTYLSEVSTPTITSVGCWYDEFGSALMELVNKVVESPEEHFETTVAAGVVMRKSCGKPRQTTI